jgi:hypothetical protein
MATEFTAHLWQLEQHGYCSNYKKKRIYFGQTDISLIMILLA